MQTVTPAAPGRAFLVARIAGPSGTRPHCGFAGHRGRTRDRRAAEQLAVPQTGAAGAVARVSYGDSGSSGGYGGSGGSRRLG